MANTYSSTRLLRYGYRCVGSALQRGFVPTLGVFASAAALLLAGQTVSQARPRAVATVVTPKPMPLSQAMLQPMRDRRILMMLPVRTGDNWKATPEFTTAFLRQSNVTVRKALAGTGRYAILEVRRFNPVLMRAVQDGVATSDDLNNLLNQPTTPNASVFLSKLTFNKAPQQSFVEPALISSFVLENMTAESNSLSVKLTGRLYSSDGQTVLRSLSATTTVPFAMAGGDMADAAASSLTTSVNRIVSEFMRVPTENEVVLGTQPTTIVAPIVVAPVTTQTGVVLPGTPIRGASTRLPGSVTFGTAGAMNGMNGNASAPMPYGGISTVVETPPAETFPAASAPLDTSAGVTPATDATVTVPTLPATDATATTPATDTTATTTTDTTASTTTDTTASTPSGTGANTGSTSTPTASGTSDAGTMNNNPVGNANTSSTSDTNPANIPSNGNNPTPTDNTAATGTTSDGTNSTGTVGGAPSGASVESESHANRQPVAPVDNSDLAFEYGN